GEHVPVRVVLGSVGRGRGDRQRRTDGHAGRGHASKVATYSGRLSMLASIRHRDVLVPPRRRLSRGQPARPCPGVLSFGGWVRGCIVLVMARRTPVVRAVRGLPSMGSTL